MRFEKVAGSVIKGMAAGAVGTVAITAFQLLESKLQGREPSTAPADAVETVLEVESKNDEAKERLTNLVHFGYGTSWGALLGVLKAVGMAPLAAAVGLFASVWGTSLVMLPSLRIGPKPTEWGGGELALDAVRHAVYASAAVAAFEAMDR